MQQRAGSAGLPQEAAVTLWAGEGGRRWEMTHGHVDERLTELALRRLGAGAAQVCRASELQEGRGAGGNRGSQEGSTWPVQASVEQGRLSPGGKAAPG